MPAASLFQNPPVNPTADVAEASVSLGTIWESDAAGKKVKRKVWDHVSAFINLNTVRASVQTVLCNQVCSLGRMHVQHVRGEIRSCAIGLFDKSSVDLCSGEYRGNHDQPHKCLPSEILLRFADFLEDIKNFRVGSIPLVVGSSTEWRGGALKCPVTNS